MMAILSNPIRTQDLTIWHLDEGGMPELAAGTYESDTCLLVQNSLGRGMTMLDLGAHIGYFSLIAARCVGSSGRVYAFEPQPKVYDVLVKNIKANGFRSTIRAVRKAVSEAAGITPLLLPRVDTGGASLYHIPGVSSSKKVVVETISLDDFFAAEGWPPVHLIKMDIEGAEKAALEGMRELSARHPNLKLIIEFNPGVQAAAGVTPQELFETLFALGFRNFSAIQGGLKPLSIPKDILRLVRMTEGTCTYMNLLCER